MTAGADIIVSGMVQGVGYRHFVLRAARRLQLTGWVKNLMTGEVEIMAEGDRGLIGSLISELSTGNPWARVNNVEVSWQKFTAQWDGFDVVF